jgi:hypothetical protein
MKVMSWINFRTAAGGTGKELLELGTKVSEILDSIRQGYDKRVRPNYGGNP